jgi:hypothetical protein
MKLIMQCADIHLKKHAWKPYISWEFSGKNG